MTNAEIIRQRKIIGNAMMLKRVNKKHTILAFSRLTGLSRKQIYQLENGRGCHIDTLIIYSDGLNR